MPTLMTRNLFDVRSLNSARDSIQDVIRSLFQSSSSSSSSSISSQSSSASSSSSAAAVTSRSHEGNLFVIEGQPLQQEGFSQTSLAYVLLCFPLFLI